MDRIAKQLILEHKVALDDCWKAHKSILKREGCKTKKELADYLRNLDVQDWEDVMFFKGFLCAIRIGIKLTR